MTEINPTYKSNHSIVQWIEELPMQFAQTGTVIYDARNQIRTFKVDGLNLCVKRFHQPRFLNRLIYGTLRAGKARRSYENAMYLTKHGVGTPYPVAYIEEYSCGMLGYSYLITLTSTLTHLNREFTLAYTPALDDTIRPLARFTARMHNEGILPLDYSPGNILWDKVNGEYEFEIVDINRMRFGNVSMREGCKSIRRICARSYFFDIFADEYAKTRGLDAAECLRLIHHYRNQFWHNGKKARYEYE